MNMGDRVQLHPATDEWMQGDRYGEVVGAISLHDKEGWHNFLSVKLDSGRVRAVHVDNVLEVV